MPLLLQPVIAMTLNVRKDWLASPEKVAARLMDETRRREDRMEWEPVGLGPRQVWRPSLKKEKRKHQTT